MYKAKIFKNGQSQAIRLPKEFRFNSKEVSISRLGKAILVQPLPVTWSNVFEQLKATQADDILISREDSTPQNREEFN